MGFERKYVILKYCIKIKKSRYLLNGNFYFIVDISKWYFILWHKGPLCEKDEDTK